MKYKAIIFDMDGTIIDSSHIWKQVTRDLIVSKGGTLNPEILENLEKELIGLAIHAACAKIKDVMKLEHTIEDLMIEKKQRVLKLYAEKLAFIEGFKNFHDRTLQENLKVGVATNADDHTLEAAVGYLELKQFFGEHIYKISDVDNKHKPAPDLYLHAAEKLGLDPKDCVAIEDSGHGIKAAVDAGMFCIGINSGKDKQALKDAHLIIDHYDEICLKRLLKKKKTKPINPTLPTS
jgi:HAD superfamily hydrolase (TIGR01509 family)